MQKIKGVSFFCPAYYDAENIGPLVNKVVNLLSGVCEDYEVIVINDGSPDNTGEALENLTSIYPKMRVIHHPGNLGYAQALKTGFKNANRFEFILFTDGDNQYDMDYFRDMIEYMQDYDVVITYRTKNANCFIRRVISWIFNRVLNIIFCEPFRDLSCAFRLVRRAALNEIKFTSNSPFLPVEIVLKLYKKGFRIKEIPIQTRKRLYGRSTALSPKNFFGSIKDMLKMRIKLSMLMRR